MGEEEGELGHALCSSAHNRGCALRDDLYPRNTQHFAETISCQTWELGRMDAICFHFENENNQSSDRVSQKQCNRQDGFET